MSDGKWRVTPEQLEYLCRNDLAERELSISNRVARDLRDALSHNAKGEPQELPPRCEVCGQPMRRDVGGWHCDFSGPAHGDLSDEDAFKHPPADSRITLADVEVHRTRADTAEAELHRRHEIEVGNVWYWQGDGSDNPESLTCQVVIRAADLRDLLAARSDAIGVIERMRAERQCDGEHPEAIDTAYQDGWLAAADAILAELRKGELG